MTDAVCTARDRHCPLILSYYFFGDHAIPPVFVCYLPFYSSLVHKWRKSGKGLFLPKHEVPDFRHLLNTLVSTSFNSIILS